MLLFQNRNYIAVVAYIKSACYWHQS